MSESDQVTIGPYRAGEIPPPIVVTFKDSSGNPIDLSSSYQARWIYRQHAIGMGIPFSASDPAAVTRTATVLNQTTNTGQVTYTWVSADLASSGDFEAEMWVGNNTNRFASVRYVYNVRDAIAIPAI